MPSKYYDIRGGFWKGRREREAVVEVSLPLLRGWSKFVVRGSRHAVFVW